jgi:nucleoside-diphosphate-sugar epimerase
VETQAGKILITGGTGFIGSFLAAELLRHNREILFLLRPQRQGMHAEARLRTLLDDFHHVPRALQRWHIITGDIRAPFCGLDERQRQALQGQLAAIWHTAASLSFKEEDRAETFQTNVCGTAEVLRLTETLGAPPLFYLSTAYVNGVQHGPIREDFLDCHARHRNPYEASKCQAEALVGAWASIPPHRATIFRPSIVVGDSRDGRTLSYFGYYAVMRTVVQLRNWLCEALAQNKVWPKLLGIRQQDNALLVPFPCFYVPGATVNIIPVDVLIRMMLRISERPESAGQTFHLVHPQPQTVRFHFEGIFDTIGLRGPRFIPINSTTAALLAAATRLTIRMLPLRLRQMLKPFSAYLDYLRGEPTFVMEATRAMIPEKDLPPLVTKAVIQRLVAYAEAHHFGRSSSESFGRPETLSVPPD